MSDSKQDMWAYGLVLLEMIGVRVREQECDLVASLWEERDNGRERLFQMTSPQLVKNGNEKIVLTPLIDVITNFLRPTPGQRYSARDVISHLLTPETRLCDLGDFLVESDIKACFPLCQRVLWKCVSCEGGEE